MFFRVLLFTLFLGTLFYGCSVEKKDSVDATKAGTSKIVRPEFPSVNTDDVFVYECDDSLQFAAYVKKDSTWLFLPDTSLKMMKVRSGSGAKYRGSSYLYWIKGTETLFQMPTGSLMNCQSIPQERSWKAAKLRGVDFRALGQEPGWHLEIKESEQITYVGNYGEDTVFTPVPEPTINQNKRTYKVETDAHTLKIEITDSSCTDSMSGFNFPSKVAVTVDGKTYHGCGRSL